MSIIPPCKRGRVVDATGRYRCPLCGVQATGDQHDTGWVRCPMIEDQWICLGCCVDHQAAARAEDFARHPFHDLFDVLSRQRGETVVQLRRKCLEHLAAILRGIPDLDPDDDEMRAVVRALSES